MPPRRAVPAAPAPAQIAQPSHESDLSICHIDKLPNELICRIFDLGWVPALRAACLVSRRWRLEVQPALWHHVFVWGKSQIEKLLAIPAPNRYRVRRLTVMGSSKSGNTVPPALVKKALAAVHGPSLESLSISAVAGQNTALLFDSLLTGPAVPRGPRSHFLQHRQGCLPSDSTLPTLLPHSRLVQDTPALELLRPIFLSSAATLRHLEFTVSDQTTPIILSLLPIVASHLTHLELTGDGIIPVPVVTLLATCASLVIFGLRGLFTQRMYKDEILLKCIGVIPARLREMIVGVGKEKGESQTLLDALALPAASELRELELHDCSWLTKEERIPKDSVVAECERRRIAFKMG